MGLIYVNILIMKEVKKREEIKEKKKKDTK